MKSNDKKAKRVYLDMLGRKENLEIEVQCNTLQRIRHPIQPRMAATITVQSFFLEVTFVVAV